MTKEERKQVDDIVMKTFTLAYELGTKLDELHRQVREVRFKTNDIDLQAALINLEHAFFMVAQSINILKEHGLDALELEYPNIDIKRKKRFYNLAKRYNLILTGGSDFHGLNRVGIDIGINSSSLEIYENLLKRKNHPKY